MCLYGVDMLKESIFLQENYEIRGFSLKTQPGQQVRGANKKTISYRVPSAIKEA